MAAGSVMSAAPASALTIELNDIGGVSGSPAQLGFQVAAKYWESVFTNDATIRLDVGYSNLGPGILGSTGSTLYQFLDISDYQTLLSLNATSALDATAVANLSPLSGTGSVDVLVPGYLTGTSGVDVDAAPRTAPDGQEISNTMAISTANLKALVGDFGYDGPDAEIQFSNQFAFDFDPRDGITPGTYDFIGVAVHEIGHALGFISGVDDFDYNNGYTGSDVDDYWWGYSADMFRYSAPGQLDWTVGTESYFSIDGGVTNLGNFSTGSQNGDGWQASHWKEPAVACTNFQGIMNPYICNGLEDSVKALDLALFDAIGWNVNFDVLQNGDYEYLTSTMRGTFVPEPSTWALMIMGFGMMGGMVRRRRPALARWGEPRPERETPPASTGGVFYGVGRGRP
ncbi:NF038122 family metalloprotease [Phenylobacterium sp.]|uniref:NF038122 family metalloprotease n=1 Tax=Phenylobacterium sp. TaxID=1871053 RepID=UPI0025E0BDEE|nr:NF038122 family metalloprotease [Phenylobacterium sp.]